MFHNRQIFGRQVFGPHGYGRHGYGVVVGGMILFAASVVPAQAQVKVETVLAFQPAQKDVDIDVPTAAELPNCKLEIERTDKGSGWVLYNPQGQILRRFMDTNGDQSVDEFRYYKHGLEVYRDLDTNGNNEVDQSRWLTTGGTRWGIDQNEDRKIEKWKVISAEEASREAVMALVTQDEARLMAVFISEEDIKEL
ncbi:MAG TPA: hypothetical protein VNQ76_01410, partial [Planctomicrobium sp.]|nr:hypothetical protein [Planctomicrobium sp.]